MFRIFLIICVSTIPSTAVAEPISIFVATIAGGAGFTAAVSTAFVAIGGWAGIAAFLASPFGSLLLGIGLQLITALFIKKPRAPSIEAAKVNVRIAEPERWLPSGRTRQGGGVIFAEYDSAGNFWYVLVHGDAILTDTFKMYFDDVEIELDENNYVTSAEFSLNEDHTISLPGPDYDFTTTTQYYQIFTTTHSFVNPTPLAITELQAAFPGIWTDDHKLVGTTYSAIRIKPVKPEHRYKVLHWRGPVGIGEPSFSIVGDWSKAFDPNDVAQVLGDASTYKFTRNPVLMWAWFRTHRYGRNKPVDDINWDRVAEQALICDIVKTDIDGGSAPQYQCDVSIPESAERNVGEQQILMSCDAQLVFDDNGKCWPHVGYFYTPSVNLSRNRDIVAMESIEAQNGESLTQGVIVRYIDPDASYTTQPCAPYTNPFYYVEGETPKYIVVDILSIQNHRQAMQLAKSISHRSQPEHKLLPTVGLRGLRARQERIVNILYDNDFAGDYEIVTPTEVDDSGAFVGFGCVPINQDRWVLLAGEEKSKPVNISSEDFITIEIPTLPTGVVIIVETSLIKINYDAPTRDDWSYEFQYQPKPDGVSVPDDVLWLTMTINLFFGLNQAYSDARILPNSNYFVRWRGVSTAGVTSDWVTPISIVDTSILVLVGAPITPATVNVPYAGFTISVTGGQSPYIFTDVYGNLPDGLTIDAATGVISGTPNLIGTFDGISVRVTDMWGINTNFFPDFEIVIEAA